MRPDIFLTSLLVSLLTTAGVLHAQTAQTKPDNPATAPAQNQPAPNPAALRVTAGDWSASVQADGSGSIGCGSSLGNYAFFPAGTFSIQAVLKSFLTPQKRKPNADGSPTYTLETDADATHAHQTAIKDAQPVTALFEQMRAACKAGKAINHSPTLESLWEKQPPTPSSRAWSD